MKRTSLIVSLLVVASFIALAYVSVQENRPAVLPVSAEAHFQQVFQRREAPQEVPTYTATGEPLGDGLYLTSLYPALS